VAFVASGALGVSVALLVVESLLTVAATAPDGPASVNEELVIVVESIAREKVAVGATLVTTPVAPFAGVVAVTVGGGAEVVVKLQITALASAAPSELFTVVSSLAV
jgi:hypothetical protein